MSDPSAASGQATPAQSGSSSWWSSNDPAADRQKTLAKLQQEQGTYGAHRCANRLDDFAQAFMHLNFTSIPSRFKLFAACMRSEIGSEPRDAHVNVPVSRLPRWDPAHPNFDPKAPYDSFARKLRPQHRIGAATKGNS